MPKVTGRRQKSSFSCDSQESNLGLLLGRQLCSPLYHNRNKNLKIWLFSHKTCVGKNTEQLNSYASHDLSEVDLRMISIFTLSLARSHPYCTVAPWSLNPTMMFVGYMSRGLILATLPKPFSGAFVHHIFFANHGTEILTINMCKFIFRWRLCRNRVQPITQTLGVHGLGEFQR